jgi:long-chain acyl-CoA synthetase
MINTSYPDKPALITKDQSVTYRGLIGNVNKFAGLFSGKGYQKIALFSENRPEWIYAFYAAWQNDATVVTIDFLSSAEDAAYIISDCRPELIFASLGTKKTWDKITGMLDYSPEIIFFENIPVEEPATVLPGKMPVD